MHRLFSLNKSAKTSFKWLKILYPKKLFMQEVQMALMEEPITQINQFSTQKLANISQNFRVSRDETLNVMSKGLQFDGKLHLDLKIDKILLQIQDCKINLAEILEMYLPNSSNSIEFKQLKLSNLKPSLSEEYQSMETKIEPQQIKKMIEGQEILQTIQLKEKRKSNQDKYRRLRRQESYEINALQALEEAQNKEKQLLEQKLQTVKQNEETSEKEIKRQDVKEQKEKIQTILDKKQAGEETGKNLTSQLSEQKMSAISNDMAQSEIKNNTQTELFSKIQKQLMNFKKTLMLRQAQLGMLIYITEMKHDETFMKKYEDIYQSLKRYVIPVDKVGQAVNVYVLEEVFEIQNQFLKQYAKYIEQIKSRMEDYKKCQNTPTSSYSLKALTTQSAYTKLQKVLKSVFKLKIINSKIITMAEIFPYACVKDLNDLFSCSQSHQRWQKLINNDIITYKIYGEPSKVRKSFEALKNNLNIINASMNILNQSKNLSVLDYKNWGKIFDSTSKILKVALFKTDAHHEAAVMIAEPDGKLAKQIWNLPENKTLQNFISAVLPAIQFSQKLYLPRVLKSYFDSQGKDPLPNEFFIKHVTQYGNHLYEKAPYQKKLPCRINAKHRINRKYQTKTWSSPQQPPKPESYSRMFFNTINSMTKVVSNMNTYFSNTKKQNLSTAILHIHGGGFISMSSFIHQTYTRNWANSLEVPILSVDYGKAPEYPYPNGLYDCLQAYMWLRFVFRQVYQTQVEKVIIVGDSAGGNLAAALTTLLIEWNLPKPDGLVLVYPALNLNFNNYTPSLLHALNDMILPHTFLKICLRAYIKDPTKDPECDSLISPICTKPQTLKKYPRTKIFVGGKDPFHDDCCKFVQKLNQQNEGIADLTIFDEFPHGFLQFDMTTNPHEQARKAIKQVQRGLKEVMQYKEK